MKEQNAMMTARGQGGAPRAPQDAADYQRIYIQGGYLDRPSERDAHRSTATRSSQDADWDIHLMLGFIELENAAARRKVPFTPHALGGIILVSPHASLWAILKGLLKARREALNNTGRIGWHKWL